VNRVRLSRIFWIGAAVVLAAAALVAIAAIVRGDFSDNDGRILVMLGALLYTGGAALAGLALADRGPARLLGAAVAAFAPVCLALIAWAIWSFTFDGDGNETVDKLAWSSVLALLAGLIATTGLLLARRPALAALAGGAGALAGLAATLSIAGIWAENDGDGFVKTLAVLWILTLLAYFLVPVLQRFTYAGAAPDEARVLASLGDVELVATRAADGRAIDPRLQPGERLALRRRY
jgi:hypothetical protein